MNRVLFSSASQHWSTPKQVYASLDEEFKFTLGNGIGRWLSKAKEADVAVFLLPARTDTKWWHEWALTANEIRFIKGRLKFSGSKNSAPFPSVILIFRP